MSATIQTLFGKAVKRFRLKRKLSQEALAHAAGMHVTYLGRIERGGQNISLSNIQKLARALKIKPAELFRGIS